MRLLKYALVSILSLNLLAAETTVDYSLAAGEKKIERLLQLTSYPWFNPERGPATLSKIKKGLTGFEYQKGPIAAFTKKQERYEFTDLDKDKKFESYRYYVAGKIQIEAELEAGSGIILKRTNFTESGNILSSQMDSNRDGFFDEMHLYRENRITSILKDADRDGHFESVDYFSGGDTSYQEYSFPHPSLFPAFHVDFFAGVYENGKISRELSDSVYQKIKAYLPSLAEDSRFTTCSFLKTQKILYSKTDLSNCLSEIYPDGKSTVLMADILASESGYYLLLRTVSDQPGTFSYSHMEKFADRTALENGLPAAVLSFLKKKFHF